MLRNYNLKTAIKGCQMEFTEGQQITKLNLTKLATLAIKSRENIRKCSHVAVRTKLGTMQKQVAKLHFSIYGHH
jgi:hypothetical protein